MGEVKPTVETCNGKDDDCDGQVDENLTRSCYSGPQNTAGKGICAAGQEACNNGTWGGCVGEIKPAAETCDGKDNDCDGMVDEGLVRSCYSGLQGTAGTGLCVAGQEACSAGSWGRCMGEVLPVAEVCGDTQDNDCDGGVDEGCGPTCSYANTFGWMGPKPSNSGHSTELSFVRWNPTATKYISVSKDLVSVEWDTTTHISSSSYYACPDLTSISFSGSTPSFDCGDRREGIPYKYLSSKMFRNGEAAYVYVYNDPRAPSLTRSTVSVSGNGLQFSYSENTIWSSSGSYPTALTADKKYFAIKAGSPNNLMIFDTTTNTKILTKAAGSLFSNFWLGRDNKTLFSLEGKDIDLYNYQGVKLRTISWSCDVHEVHMTPSLKDLVIRDCNDIVLLDFATGQLIRKFQVSGVRATDFDVSFDGKKILVGYLDASVRIWDLQAGTILHTTQKATPATSFLHTGNVTLNFINKNKFLVSRGTKITNVWEVATGTLKWSSANQSVWQGAPLVFLAPDDKHLVATDYKTIQVFDLTTGLLDHVPAIGHAGPVAFHPVRTIFVLGSKLGFSTYNYLTRRVVSFFHLPSTYSPSKLRYTSNGSQFLELRGDIILRDATTFQEIKRQSFSSSTVSQDFKYVANYKSVFDVDQWMFVASMQGLKGSFGSAWFSSDGSVLMNDIYDLTGLYQERCLLYTATNQSSCLRLFDPSPGSGFPPQYPYKLNYTGAKGTYGLIDKGLVQVPYPLPSTAPTPLFSFSVPDYTFARFQDDAKVIAFGLKDGRVQLWKCK